MSDIKTNVEIRELEFGSRQGPKVINPMQRGKEYETATITQLETTTCQQGSSPAAVEGCELAVAQQSLSEKGSDDNLDVIVRSEEDPRQIFLLMIQGSQKQLEDLKQSLSSSSKESGWTASFTLFKSGSKIRILGTRENQYRVLSAETNPKSGTSEKSETARVKPWDDIKYDF